MANRSESEVLTALPLKMTTYISKCLYLYASLHGGISQET
jgi:hypothetical protein